MQQFNTPLRYPGGKGRLSQFIADTMESNRLTGGHYAEAYAGGAAIAVSLLQLEYASHIHINDLNRSVHAFWHCVLHDTEALCKRIRSTRVSMAEWRRQREVQELDDVEPLDLAFSTFFLNRTNRSGIIRGGVIGGKKQDGAWKLNARYNKPDLIARIERIAALRTRISLYRRDAKDFISDVLPELPRRTLVYLDPPYYVKGKGLYENHYTHTDHELIASLVDRIAQPWVVSYDNVEPIRRMYSRHRQHFFGLRYSAQDRYEGSEILVAGPGVSIGEIRPSRAIAA